MNAETEKPAEVSGSEQEPLVNPLCLIAEERHRQKEVEGWTPEHDDEHIDQGLAMGAALYASPVDNLMHVSFCESCDTPHVRDPWPWWNRVDPPRGGPLISVRAWDKRDKHNRMRRLQIAGALIVAEMERLQRLDG